MVRAGRHKAVIRCRPPDTPAALAHAFELAKEEFSCEFHHYVDFYLLLQLHDDALAECVTLAKAWGKLERPLFGALHCDIRAVSGCGRQLWSPAMEQLASMRRRGVFLIDRALPDPATEGSGHAAGRRVQIRRKFALIDRRWRRVAFIAA